MPPTSPRRGALLDENPPLSDQDVGLLYQIITRAEQKPDVERLPFRAVFSAYDEVIAEHGVEADEGQVCLRFLFKMGNKGLRGDSLFEKFEELLAQMGIVLELGDSDNDNETRSYHANHVGGGAVDAGGETGTVDRETSHNRGRRRRASFNSMYDVGDNPTERSIAWRPSSRSSMSRLQIGKPEFPEKTPPKRAKGNGKRGRSPDRTQLLAQFLEAGRRLMSRLDSRTDDKRKHGKALANKEREREREQLHAVVNGINGTRHSRSRRSRVSSGSDTSDEEEGIDDLIDDEHASIEKEDFPPEMVYRPTLSQLLRDASTFDMYRRRANARRILTQWLKKAVQLQQSHRNMEAVAINRDRLTLLRQAFDSWLGVLRERSHEAQTERFFRHLEERAGRARDLYLMTKAFTHWAQVTSDEVKKTSDARKHILRVKYFNAWREITAVNELKAQRFGLKRPLALWRRKLQDVRANDATAAALYNKNLKKRIYWKWFWNFCDRRAPQWHDFCLKRRSLIYWIRSLRTQRDNEQEIDERNKRYLLGSALQAWSEKSKRTLSAQQEADTRQRRKLLHQNFDEWHVQARLAPAANQVTTMVDKRLLETTYDQWIHRLGMLEQAKKMDRTRLLRNAWVTWNDLLRCQALNARIEERLKVETLYKWVLAERFRLMQRIHEQRITQESFAAFVANAHGMSSRLLQREQEFRARRKHKLLRTKFTCWYDQLVRQRQRELIAFEFYAPRLEQESLALWRCKHEQIAKMDGWARDARYYFLATKTIKRWKAATLESAKRRRQDAYAKVRRKIKINLASNAMATWRSKAQHTMELEQQATDIALDKTHSIAIQLLERWHDKAAKNTQDHRDADIYYNRQLAYHKLARWVESFNKNRTIEERAMQLEHVRTLGLASQQLRKLSLRIFQVRSHIETADAMRERNLRKHFRNIFWHWVDKARVTQQARSHLSGPTATETNGSTSTITDTKENNSPSPFDRWPEMETAFNFSELLATSEKPPPISPFSFATPGYLGSPSKRAARARALAQLSTTPATPLRTPFAARLRAELDDAKVGSGRRGGTSTNRRSSLGTSVRFVDVEPESPTDGRRSANKRS
ncbi:hypothetical protein Plec18167_002418 [Paecilomyces lecythidis]|uniref:Sfi1 spindle body domain-containing protein n=1 Tax=Paecilomyces lecythidis TaxID=3004212 RepID=A0ABR3Y6R0_9EURO